MTLVLPLLLTLCVQDDRDEKLRELDAIRQKMGAEIKEYESLVKDMKAHYQSIEEAIKDLKTHEPKKSGDALDEVRALRKEVAELRSIVKELVAGGGHTAGSMKMVPEPPQPWMDEEGRLLLKVGDAEGVNEVLVYVKGRDEPLRFVLKKETKKREKSEKVEPEQKPRKSKPIDAEEQPDCEECPFQGECPLDPGPQSSVWY